MRDLFERIMRPQSVAIIGMSSKPNTMSHALLSNLTINEFGGAIHLVGRTEGTIDGRPIRADWRDVPADLDIALLAVPAAGVADALAACVERRAGAAIVFASGFAEVGDRERDEQERIGQMARDGGVAVIGPNCIGYTNLRDRFSVGFANVTKITGIDPGTNDAVAIVSQSGGLGGHVRLSMMARNVAVSYIVSTGNEMGLGLGDFTGFLLDDEATRVICIYAEHIRQPEAFLAAARRARRLGKAIVMLHSGRGERAQEAAKSHTGALAGDYAVMRAQVERAGVVVVDTLDELTDVTEILARYPLPSKGGLGVMTLSGAYCGLAHDFCEDLGVAIPALSPESEAHLRAVLPAYTAPRNPLDLGTQPIWQPELMKIGLETLLADDAIGAVALSIPGGAVVESFLTNVIAGQVGNTKPLSVAVHGDANPLPAGVVERARECKLVLSRSSDRTLRAIGTVLQWGNRPAPAFTAGAPTINGMPQLGAGTQPEWLGKRVLAAAGIAVPRGRLATTAEEAVAIAAELGYPVALKAQAAALAHKTEAGGVLLNIADSGAVRTGWATLHANVERAQPGLSLDGVLVEAMARRGLELVAGARRDPQWGPVLLVGLGGILVEALDDVRIIAADATHSEVRAELDRLKAAKLLHGFRAMPPVDVDAVATAVTALGRLMRAYPHIVEIDVNPIVAHARGEGATALDALIVTSDHSHQDSPLRPPLAPLERSAP
jgi:acyl-CoA synthetase (NDP forming)